MILPAPGAIHAMLIFPPKKNEWCRRHVVNTVCKVFTEPYLIYIYMCMCVWIDIDAGIMVENLVLLTVRSSFDRMKL